MESVRATSLTKGTLLIAEPFLGDPNFERSVVLLCDHHVRGSFGFVLNHPAEWQLADVIEDDIYPDVPLYTGGPVEKNTLHYVHCRPDLIEEATRVREGLYFGGNFDQIKRQLNLGVLTPRDIRFFIGYSGWGAGQLAKELRQNSWYLAETEPAHLFATPPEQLWRSVLRGMGGEYKVLSHYPTDPSLN
jgi:putative transcriptional regulator